MRLIDADGLIEIFNASKYDVVQMYGDDGYSFSLVEMLINEAPTVDAEPVRHGEWLDAEDTGIKMAECSICGARNTVHTYLYKPYPWRWCYRCGAKMDNAEWGRDT